MKRFFLIAALGATQMAGAGEASRLVLAESASARGEHVRLDEILAEPEAAAFSVPLSSVFMGAAPEAGSQRTITRGEVVLRLAQAGISGVEVSGEAVRVSRGGGAPAAEARDVCVARRNLAAGTVVSAGDVAFRKALPGERTGGFLGEAAVIGRELALAVAAGVPFAAGRPGRRSA